MAGRRCTTCGAAVSDSPVVCPRCGADPDVAVIEIGATAGRGGSHARLVRGGDGRRWLPVVLAVAAVWALLAVLGAFGDRSDGDDEDAAPPPTTTDASGPPRTAKSATGTLPDGPVPGAPAGLHLVVGSAGDAVDIDLASGTLTTQELGGELVDGDERGVLVRSERTYSWRPFPLESGEQRDVADAAGNAWLLDGLNAAWVDVFAGSFALVDLDRGGRLTAVTLPAPAYPMGATGDRLVVEAAGSVYSVDTGGGIAELGAGRVHALGGGQALLERCDAALRCGYVLVDLRTGVISEVPTQSVLTRLSMVDGLWVGLGGRIVTTVHGPTGTSLVRTDQSPAVELLEPTYDLGSVSAVAFSPDGRWIAVAGNRSTWIGATDGSGGAIADIGRVGPSDVVLLVQRDG